MVKTKKKKSLEFKKKMAWILGLVMICVFGTMLSGENVQGADVRLVNPKTITVNVRSGLELLDTFGPYIKVDNYVVTDNMVNVEKADIHKISILPQFGYSIEAKINGNIVDGVEEEGWQVYTVAEADIYDIEVSKEGSSIYTVTWAYDDTFGEDGKVSNGSVRIISAIMPDGSNGIENVNDQNDKGGLVAIKPDSMVTVEIKPDYGYQFVAGSLNGNTITAGYEVSTFTFIMPRTNLHLSALFTKTDDIINTDCSDVKSGSISNGENVVNSGNIRLEVKDLSENEVAVLEDDIKENVGNDVVSAYLDMNLFSVVNKGNKTDVWENQLTELTDNLTVTLNLADDLKGKDGSFYIIREHMEADGSKSFAKIPVIYDKENGTISFDTDKFSTYALVYSTDDNSRNDSDNNDNIDNNGNDATGKNDNNSDEKATDTKPSNAKAPKTGDTTQVMALVIIMITGIIVTVSAFKNRTNE
ncbi:MAG: hypothetical protein SPL51_07610 [Lachnospiraceae bacterium]|nr:hypothetical protein [Lachnospiraceae bacterium]